MRYVARWSDYKPRESPSISFWMKIYLIPLSTPFYLELIIINSTISTEFRLNLELKKINSIMYLSTITTAGLALVNPQILIQNGNIFVCWQAFLKYFIQSLVSIFGYIFAIAATIHKD
jgi:hypothetical protein